MFKPQAKKAINSSKILQKLYILLPIGIVGNLIFVYFTSERSILSFVNAFTIKHLVFCFILGVFPWFTHSLRIFVWARFLGKNLTFKQLLKIVIMSELGAAASPTAIGGGPFKFCMLTRTGLKSGTALSLTILGSIEDYTFWILSIPLAMYFVGSIKLPFLHNFKMLLANQQFLSIGGILIMGFIIILILNKLHVLRLKEWLKLLKFPAKIRHFFQPTFQDFKFVYRSILGYGKQFFILNIFLTSLQWIGKFSILIVLTSCLNISVDPIQFFFWQWIVFVALTFIPTPGAAVGAEATFYFVFKNFIPGNFIGVITIAWRFFTYYSNLMLGIIILFLINLLELAYEQKAAPTSFFIPVETK
jgi:uncharacterized protein (TIRG00374 family)